MKNGATDGHAMKSEPILSNPFRKDWWPRFFFADFTANSLGLFRIYFAFGLLFYHVVQVKFLFEIAPFGEIFYFADPIWYFRLIGIYSNIPWITYLAIFVIIGATISLMLGYRTRTSIIILFFAIMYVKGVRDSFDGDVHHRYVVPANILIIFLFSRCGEILSLDARKKTRLRQVVTPVENWAASWPLKAIQVYVAFYYFFAAIAKLRLVGLNWIGDGGQVQIKLVERSMRYGLTENGEAVRMKLGYALAQLPDLLVVFVSLVIAFELLSPLILLTRSRLYRILYVLGATSFHIANYVLLSVMFILYPFILLVFFDLAKVYAKIQPRLGLLPLEPQAEPEPHPS